MGILFAVGVASWFALVTPTAYVVWYLCSWYLGEL